MKISDTWWTSPQEGEHGNLVMVTGHDGLDEVIASGKYIYRIDVHWKYDAATNGMPSDDDAELMEKITDALTKAFKADKVAVITGIYTGDGERTWVLYTKNLKVFGIVFNRALQELPTVPLVIDASSDPNWDEYKEMRDISYIPDGE